MNLKKKTKQNKQSENIECGKFIHGFSYGLLQRPETPRGGS